MCVLPVPSAEALREEAAEAERLVARDGVPPKTAAVVRSLMRRWSAFLEVHGDEYGSRSHAPRTARPQCISVLAQTLTLTSSADAKTIA